MSESKIKVVMISGVAGTGKTTVGQLLADHLGWLFCDADDFHSQANKDKMSRGEALSDEDRRPWLERLRQEVIQPAIRDSRPVILACSALKENYRRILIEKDCNIVNIFLKADYELIHHRLAQREAHYFKESLLQSQFNQLEEPLDAWVVDASKSVDEIVELIKKKYNFASRK